MDDQSDKNNKNTCGKSGHPLSPGVTRIHAKAEEGKCFGESGVCAYQSEIDEPHKSKIETIRLPSNAPCACQGALEINADCGDYIPSSKRCGSTDECIHQNYGSTEVELNEASQ